MAALKRLVGWGRYPAVEAEESVSEDLERASQDAILSRGLGRSYGDSSLPPAGGHTVTCTRLGDRLLAFDPETGVLRAEAGLSARKLTTLFLPRGWASPVYPGTTYVTLGGMAASDVHGKNHHVAGCFGEHVRSLKMRVPDGRVLEVSEDNHPELFRATLGGMGLTGHILEVEVQLERIPSPWIWMQSEQVHDLDEIVTKLREAGREWPFTMVWADSVARGRAMGRGILIVGRWAQAHEAPERVPAFRERIGVPFDLPSWTLNPLSVRLFNMAVFHKHGRRMRRGITHPQPFFFPLDAIRNWNRIYGSRGLTQYQCVIPMDDGGDAYQRFFETLTRSGAASFLTVIKDCGPEGKGMLSFPKPGISIALDLPMRGASTQARVDAMNEIVIAAGGRMYLTKDALTRPEHYRAMEPRLEAWREVRRKWDPDGRLRSALSVRLFGDDE